MTFRELSGWLSGELGLKPYRAAQVFRWIHVRGAASFGEMTDLGRDLRQRLSDIAEIAVPVERGRQESADGTLKVLLGLEDGLTVESVLIPDRNRLTACLSTQVGCRMGCTFCMTGRTGFRRNLEPDEIVSQLYSLRAAVSRRITNVVLMGMGEPFDNAGAVSEALDILTDDHGECIGSRKITVSTIGLPGTIGEFASLPGQYGLAVSLHSAVQETRESLVPAARALPLPLLKSDLVSYAEAKGRRVTLEYCLIRGVNDSIEQAGELARFTRNLPCKLNLLTYNRIQGIDLEPPPEERVRRFVDYLYPRCPAVTLRRSRGADIAAACGQLGASLLEPVQDRAVDGTGTAGREMTV
jgi:23S rRNA (adenine2503-C2)-methyltransferase